MKLNSHYFSRGIVAGVAWFIFLIPSAYAWHAGLASDYNNPARSNGYAIHPPLSHHCDPVPCTKTTLLQAYKHLQYKSLHKNRHIPPPHSEPGKLRIVTYNVHFWQEAGNHQFSRNDHVADRIIDELLQMDADIYLLQEVVFDPTIIGRLFNALNIAGDNYYFCSEADNYKGSFDLGNLTLFRIRGNFLYTNFHYYNPNALLDDKPDSSGTERLATAGPRLPGRCSILNTFIPEGLDKAVQLVNVHLDHTDDSVHKTQQLRGILRMMNTAPFLVKIDTRMIGGDFNTPMASQLSRPLQESIENDARARNTTVNMRILELLNVFGYEDSFDHACLAPPGTTVWSLIRIDYLFVNKYSSVCFKGLYSFHTLNSDHSALLFDMDFID